MAIVTRPVRFDLVMRILSGKKYGVQTMHRYALALNKPTGRKFDSGSEERKMVGRGLSRDELDAILLHSETEEEAADRIEAAILGSEMLPIDDVKAASRGPSALDASVVERMVSNRVAAEVDRVMAPVLAQIPTSVAEACKPYIDQMLGVVSLVKELVAGMPQQPQWEKSKVEPTPVPQQPQWEKSKVEPTPVPQQPSAIETMKARLGEIDGRSKEARELRAKLAAASVSKELA